ncbi:MAG: hypothetical protein PWP23_2317 [Candidatus Sumerlaeota bacterium]|nr:hypothetical protein [Candidatus Sumerlaeota bacterium]
MQANPERNRCGEKPARHPSDNRWERNRLHWEQTLDAHNLAGEARPAQLERDLALFETADVRWALRAIEPLRGRVVLDVGGGLALAAVLMARRGARVVISDISLPRLKEARRNLERLGLAGRVDLVVAAAETLPLADSSVDHVFTKSVLIHTRLPEAARECGRVLAPGGCGAFIEPRTGNPFVNLYRRVGAPGIWRTITTYFREQEFRTLLDGLRRGSGEKGAVRYRAFFLLGFFASAFAFALPMPRVYRVFERVLLAADSALFRVFPGLRKRAWFGVLVFRKADKP